MLVTMLKCKLHRATVTEALKPLELKGIFRRERGLIRILDPDQKMPAGALRVRPAEQRRPRPADVQVPRRRRGETADIVRHAG